MNGIVQYFRNSYKELKYKVTWPTWEDLEQSTVVVLIGSIFLALMLFGMDKVIILALQLLVYGS